MALRADAKRHQLPAERDSLVHLGNCGLDELPERVRDGLHTGRVAAEELLACDGITLSG